jgi:hypothetical protein
MRRFGSKADSRIKYNPDSGQRPTLYECVNQPLSQTFRESLVIMNLVRE